MMFTNSNPLSDDLPAFQEPIRVGFPNIGDRERLVKRVYEMLDHRWFTNNGPFVREFEERLAEKIGVRNCIAVCNATLGLQIAARVLDLSGEVIVPGFTFIATPHALEWQRITPIFCDIDPSTHNIDPNEIEPLITPRTSGILAVHIWGRPCQIEILHKIADHYHLNLLFDAAHAFGASYKQKMIGNFGDMEVFSLHATKYIHSLEGGLITTNNDDLARKVRSMRNFGFDVENYSSSIGTNAKMNEFSAAMGLVLLEDMDRLIDLNYRIYETYQKELEGFPGITLARYDQNEQCNYQYVIIEVDEQIAQISRDHLMEILARENVFTRRYFFPGCHKMEPYLSREIQAGLVLPHTEQVVMRVLALPSREARSEQNVKKICQIISTAINQSTSSIKEHTAL